MGFLDLLHGIFDPNPPVGQPPQNPGNLYASPVWEFPIKKKKENGFYPIICPYCLEEFKIWDVEFRAMATAGSSNNSTATNSEQLSNDQMENFGRSSRGSIKTDNTNNGTQIKQGANSGANAFGMEPDEKYNEFEKLVGSPNIAGDRGKVLRIFDENGQPTGEVTHVTLMDPVKGGADPNYKSVPIGRFKYEELKMRPIMSVIDKYGNISKERICPHCHHRVSDNVGIWPSYTIALIGDTFVGKTVYLYRLGEVLTGEGLLDGNMIGHEANPDYKSWIRLAMEMDEKAKNNESTGGLTSITFMPPNIINFNDLTEDDGFILNLFDFPGEVLSAEINPDDYKPKEGVLSLDAFKGHYLRKIERVDAWMLLFDSISFNTVRNAFKDSELEQYLQGRTSPIAPIELLSHFETEYLSGSHNKFTQPVAVIISKSDLIALAEAEKEGCFSNLAKDRSFLDNNNKNRDKSKVDLDDIFNCAEEIGVFLQDDKKDSNLVKRVKKDTMNGESCFFALSSKGDAHAAQATPIRVTEPMEWILWRLGLVQGQGTRVPGGGNPKKVE